ncbi:hypothetical protein ACQPZZ_37880 [Microbispora sp. CA-135349]|uniref:hypothetical protein n=1 Tax=Microbispora sp. CA-135349 TaxID=3239953 RepID=UPI003D8AACAF
MYGTGILTNPAIGVERRAKVWSPVPLSTLISSARSDSVGACFLPQSAMAVICASGVVLTPLARKSPSKSVTKVVSRSDAWRRSAAMAFIAAGSMPQKSPPGVVIASFLPRLGVRGVRSADAG